MAGIVHGDFGAASHAISGARIVFRIEGKKVAFATNVTYQIRHDHVPVLVLDQLEPEEYAEVGYYITFSASGFRVPGYSPMGDIMPVLQDILYQGELSAEIYDKVSKKILLKLYRVKPIARAGQYAAGQLAGDNMDFVAIKAGDENVLDPGDSSVEKIAAGTNSGL